MNNDNKNKIKVIISEEAATGVYSNNVIINFNNTEFMLDFALFQPQNGTNKVQSRVIMHPDNVKLLLKSLEKTLKMYEDNKKNMTTGITNLNNNTIQ